MDLESECSGSALESVEDNYELNPEIAFHVYEISTEVENDDGLSLDTDLKVKKYMESTIPVLSHSPPSATRSPVVPKESPPPVVTKGYGLKKWRRIKRDFIRDSSPNIDNGKILKRASSSSVNPARPHLSIETNHTSEGSVGSVNMLIRNSIVAECFPMVGTSFYPRVSIGSGFAVGVNSEENNEDESSKSSTAASTPKLRYDVPAVSGIARERKGIKNFSGKAVSNSMHPVHNGSCRIGISKKPKGERVKIEKQNSHSSMESESRSSNFVFLQRGSSSVLINGKQNGRSIDHDGDDSDDGQISEEQFGEEQQTCYHNDSVGQVDNLSQNVIGAGSSWEGKKEEISEDHQPSIDQDPLAESVILLQSAQEALEKEVKKLGEIGKESISSCDTFFNGISSAPNFSIIDPGHSEPSSSSRLGSKGMRQNASCSLETQMLSLKERVHFLESKLEEASVMLKEKGSKVIELDAALYSCNPQMRKSGSTQEEECKEMESELEALFKLNIEAEVEFLAITQKLRVAAEDQETVVEEQRALTGQQAQLLDKLKEAESKIVMLKERADWEMTYFADCLAAEEVLRMEKRVLRATSYLFIQLILLALVFGLLILRLAPHSAVVVPT